MSEPEQSTSNNSATKNSITPSTDQQIPLKILAIGSAYEDTILYVDKFPPEDGKQRAQRVEKRRGGNSGNTLTVLSQFTNVDAWFMASMASKEASTPSASHAPVAYIIHADNTGSRTIINYNSIDELTFDEFQKIFDDTCMRDNSSIPFNWIHFEGRNAAEEAKMIEYIDTKDWRNNTIISVEFEKPFRRGLEALIDKADVLFFSKVFAEGKGYDHADEFLQIMSPYSGAMCFHNPTKKLFSAPALAIPSVVDSVGAGDTFNAGAIYSLSQGMPPESCLRFSCELAGRKCAQIGFDGVVEKMKLAAMKKEEITANKQMI
ncbi:20336_t:CDS:2 [Cetraspora pellucida]|uniref:20336_t:CDS:1 n=1 Tax=Cetraspora pellucida TaxID=1433469 RepID=A0A9N9JJ07_9GLOM|nr:20336_t:CDS:2 [Cetraspora pellucida]